MFELCVPLFDLCPPHGFEGLEQLLALIVRNLAGHAGDVHSGFTASNFSSYVGWKRFSIDEISIIADDGLVRVALVVVGGLPRLDVGDRHAEILAPLCVGAHVLQVELVLS